MPEAPVRLQLIKKNLQNQTAENRQPPMSPSPETTITTQATSSHYFSFLSSYGQKNSWSGYLCMRFGGCGFRQTSCRSHAAVEVVVSKSQTRNEARKVPAWHLINRQQKTSGPQIRNRRSPREMPNSKLKRAGGHRQLTKPWRISQIRGEGQPTLSRGFRWDMSTRSI